MARKILIVLCILMGLPAAGSPFQVPEYVSSVPAGHFAGVSAPCATMTDARRSAIRDVARQVLGSVGVSYDLSFSSSVSGDPRRPVRQVSDRLTGFAHGVVVDVERNIIKSDWLRDRGRNICFILVRYPDKLILEMRRLSRGAKVVASYHDGVLSVSEVNGVSVVLTSADVTIRKRNRYAPWISFYVWKVPLGSKGLYSVALDPVEVCGGSREIRLQIRTGKDIGDYLLGADLTHTAVLHGHDELGRAVSVKVRF